MIGNSHNENQTENQIIFLNLFQIRNFITTLQEVCLEATNFKAFLRIEQQVSFLLKKTPISLIVLSFVRTVFKLLDFDAKETKSSSGLLMYTHGASYTLGEGSTMM